MRSAHEGQQEHSTQPDVENRTAARDRNPFAGMAAPVQLRKWADDADHSAAMLRLSGEADEAVVYDVLAQQWRSLAERQEVMRGENRDG
jgi:hypothetical protein